MINNNSSLNKNLKPTKSNIKKLIYANISFLKDIYILELFGGTADISFNLFLTNANKIIILEKNTEIYKNIQLKKYNAKLNNNVQIKKYDSYNFLDQISFLNISVLLSDAPYNKNKMTDQIININRIKFIQKYLLIFIETNYKITLKHNLINLFLLKKCKKGQTIFYLIKRI